jgi:hypothetical protein
MTAEQKIMMERNITLFGAPKKSNMKIEANEPKTTPDRSNVYSIKL